MSKNEEEFVVRCMTCRTEWDLDMDPTECTCDDGIWVRVYKGDPNRVSAMCWDGRHHRCTGWLLVGSHHRDTGYATSLRCECRTCNHPPVRRDRHLHEPPQGGVVWST